MITKEILEIISKSYYSNQIIMKIANITFLLQSKLNNRLKKIYKEANKFMPAYCIPTKEVIKYFYLGIDFLKTIAYFDKK